MQKKNRVLRPVAYLVLLHLLGAPVHEIKRESARRVVPTIQPGGAGWGPVREGGARVWFWDTVGRHGQGSTQLVEELGHPLLQRAAARSPPARPRRAGRTHGAAELLHEEVQRRGAHGEHAATIAAAPGGRHCGDGPFARRRDQLETRRARGELVRVRVIGLATPNPNPNPNPEPDPDPDPDPNPNPI